jgi:hypothetical protein
MVVQAPPSVSVALPPALPKGDNAVPLAPKTSEPLQNPSPAAAGQGGGSGGIMPADPRAAYEDLFISLFNGDVPEVSRLLLAGSDGRSQIAVQDHLNLATAIRNLRDACGERFGSKDDANTIIGAWNPTGLLMRVNGMQQMIRGNQGMLALRSERVMLVRVDGQWKIDMAAYIQDAAHPFASIHFTMPRQTFVLNELVKEIQAGRFADAKAAAQAFQDRTTGEKLESVHVPATILPSPSAP